MLVLFFAKYAAVLALLLLTSAGAGTLAAGPREALALRAALGLALFGQACFFLAAAGQLHAAPMIALTIIAIVGGAWRARGIARPSASHLVAGVLVFAPLFVFALYPPVAFDETLYHLPFVRALAHDGALRFLPAMRFPVFPQIHELLCVPLFLLGGDVATHLVALAEVIVIAALLMEWGKRYEIRAGWLAAALFLGSPLVVRLATITYVEAALTLFVAAGFYALDRERFVLAGFLLGTSCSVKYLGWYFAAAALIIVLMRTAGRRREAVMFVIGCAAAALPTSAWIVMKTHDPFFPFASTSLWSLPPSRVISIGERVAGALRVIWDVTFARGRMNHQPPITPLLIAMVAVVIAASIRDTRARWVALLCAGYVAVFAFLPQDSRYLVPLLPLLGVIAAVIVARRWKSAATLLAIIAVAPGIAYAGYRIAMQGVPPVTASQRSAWLSQQVPAYRALVHAGNERFYVCGSEQLKDYAGGELLGDFNGPFSYDRILGGAHDTASIAQRLRRIDAQYFLVVKRNCQPPRSNGGMMLAYEDAAAQLWRVQPASER
ncbi:MAG TPA: hypothetical protein VHX14_05745 [Thermoanaerobaculia bacterium]|jgi:hypothetical protein|nr:hypothetical protein [Thermoanaerobaculia bacterium]